MLAHVDISKQVHFDHASEYFQLHLFEGGVSRSPLSQHQNIDAAELGDGKLCQILGDLRVADVTWECLHLAVIELTRAL